ncbi:hypothetical protein BU26DRAFT_517832 [Trematosphaeria pertusa]|uniref:DUF7580 domain-containing protein n=1 Tax=Trematosphaeria pertusa TaxID=390896 RepID=A0A6A6INP2_9PLEO|nr:uncharacterized protein BU26DRAFT_517832 [Trematosphaeria pertusa]KAF2251103.1 hypothetical protein BU26DRAFT_517832 [Trematosphaeria pertusa]
MTTLPASSPFGPPAPEAVPDGIQHLCTVVATWEPTQRNRCVRYLAGASRRKLGVYLLEGTLSCQQQWTAYSLRDTLTSKSEVGREFSNHAKLRVAVDLVSSVLQLANTPWLDERWKEDIIFVHRPGAPITSIYEHPFVHREFTLSIDDECTKHQTAACRVIRNQTLFTLGILLIELWYGKSIHELQTPQDLNCEGTPDVAWCTAGRLVENKLEFDAGRCYAEAVRRCVRCDFGRRDVSFGDEGFQQAVYDGVVLMLEKTLQPFNGLD